MAIVLPFSNEGVRPIWQGVDRRSPINQDVSWLDNPLGVYLPTPWLSGGSRLFDLLNRYHSGGFGATANPTWLPAAAGHSIVFDGVNDIISLPSVMGTAFGTYSSRCIIAIGRNSNPSTDGRLVTFGVTSPNRFHIGSVGPDGFVYVGNSAIISAAGSMPVGTDFMAAAEYDSVTSTATFYLNGVAVASAGSVSLTGTTTAPYFGGYAPGNTHWAGRLFSAFVMGAAIGPAGHAAAYDDYRRGWRSLLRRRRSTFYSFAVPANGDITGSSATTEDSDSVFATGTVAIAGGSATTEAGDTVSVVGTVAISGSHSSTEAADVVAAAGAIAISGSSVTTEADDTVTASSSSSSTGSGVTTEDPDTVSGTGSVLIVGQSVTTEAADTVTAAGMAAISGQSATTDAPDTVAGAGIVLITGSSNTTEAPDTVTASGHNGTTQAGSPFRSRFLRSSVLRGSKL